MENASKALIIAGAILLAILLIALGVYIFNQASANTGTEDLQSTQIQSHNDPFQRYEGSAVTGTEVKALIDLIRNNNLNYDPTDLAEINVTGVQSVSSDGDWSGLKNTIVPSSTYEVKVTQYYTTGAYSGYIQTMSIVKKN